MLDCLSIFLLLFPYVVMEDKIVFGSFERGRGLLSSGYSSDRVGCRSILKTPQEFESSAPRRLSFVGSSVGKGRSVHREMGDLDGPFGPGYNMNECDEVHDDPNRCDRFDLDPRMLGVKKFQILIDLILMKD